MRPDVQGAVLRCLQDARGGWVTREDLMRAAYGPDLSRAPARGWGVVKMAMTRQRSALAAAGMRLDWAAGCGWRIVPGAVPEPLQRKYKPWTPTETATAREMYAAGHSMREIAAALNRTRKAVEQYLRDYRKATGEAPRRPAAPRRRQSWSAEDDAKLLRLLKQPRRLAWVAEQMGRSLDSVKGRAWKLRHRERVLRPKRERRPALVPLKPTPKPVAPKPTDAIFAGCFRGQDVRLRPLPGRPLTLAQAVERYGRQAYRRAA